VNESQFASEYRAVVKALEPKATIFRHVEQMTRDVPDTSITLNERTIWVEFKRSWWEAPEDFDYPQEKTHTAMGNVWVVVFVVQGAATLAQVLTFNPTRPFPLPWNVLSGRKARLEAYRRSWSQIRTALWA